MSLEANPQDASTTATTIAARDAAFAAFTGGFRLVDLTDALGPDTVLWPGAPALEIVDAVSHDSGGYHARIFTTFEHAGTHFDAPEHFVPGGADTASIGIDDLVVPAVVIDLTEKAAADANAVVEVSDIEAFEAAHGTIEAGSAVLLNSGWAHRKDSALSYAGTESTTDLRFPGSGSRRPDCSSPAVSSASASTRSASIRVTSPTSPSTATSHTQPDCGTWRT